MVLSRCFYSENYVFAQTGQLSSKLQAANVAVRETFIVVLNAEKAGANVTLLLAKLNIAGELLADAQNAYNSGNASIVTSMAEKANQIANQVSDDALNLLDSRLVENQNSFWLTLTFSVFGAVVFVVSLLFVWRRFNRNFTNNLLGMKPEVVDNTT